LLLHGTGGLGKSCLAGKFCDRFKDHALIIVHGKLTAAKFLEAVKDAFIRTGDDNGLEIVQQRLKIPDKIRVLCSVSFQKEKYLIVLDDFEKNLKGYEQGIPVLSDEVFPILETLLQYLPLAVKETQLIITSRYTFSLAVNGRDLVKERLESIGLTSFRGADERKKVAELQYIDQYDDPDIRQKLIDAGRGNPRLMEALNSLVMVEKVLDEALLKKVKGKQEEFVQKLVLREILESQPQNFQKVMQYASVYGLPVSRKGFEKVCGKIENWKSFIDSGVQLSLVEKGRDRMVYYWVTPLLQEGIFKELSEDEQKLCHEGAVKHYQEVVATDGYQPLYAFELIEHALLCGMDEAAVKEGGRLLSYLRSVLLYGEALSEGGHILSSISEMKENEDFSLLLNELGMILFDVGDYKKAITCFEKALEIDRKVYGEEHPDVATRLNNLGLAWYSLGDCKKAVEYYEKALEIDGKVYGEEHPHVAKYLNNLGEVWRSLGDYEKAIQYYEKALEIDRKVYGEEHPDVAIYLNNLGLAWRSLGDYRKAIQYYEKALEIDRKVYGEEHPDVAIRLNNLGLAWRSLGDYRKAIQYYEKALSIIMKMYGEKHPYAAAMLGNLGMAWLSLETPKKAIEYIQKAYTISQEVLGDNHPDTKAAKEMLDILKRSTHE